MFELFSAISSMFSLFLKLVPYAFLLGVSIGLVGGFTYVITCEIQEKLSDFRSYLLQRKYGKMRKK